MQALGEVGGGEVRRPADHDLLLVPLDQAFQDHRENSGGVRPFAGLDPLRQVGDHRGYLGQHPPVEAGVENRPQLGDGVLLDRRGQLHHALLHPAGVGDQHQQQPLRRQRHQLHVPDRRPGQGGILDHRHLPGQLGQQAHGARDHVVQVVGAGQERLDRPPLGGRQRLDPGQPVDEQPVPLVGGDPARARVRLRDVALLLEHGHVVADGGGRHIQVMPVDERLRAHRFHGGHVVLHDGAQHCELPVVEHVSPLWHSILPSAKSMAARASWHRSAHTGGAAGRAELGRMVPL